jgi:hypothetical protein
MQSTAPFAFLIAALTIGCGDNDDPPRKDGPSVWPETVAGPAGEGAGVRVFSGHAATLSNGEACTAERGAEADRWCGFVAQSSEGLRNLFVVNVSQVIAGVEVDCNAEGGDPNCLLLTEGVGGSGADRHATFFAGDTLVYYDAALTPHVWRPGMEAGRVLAERPEGVDFVFCKPAPEGTAVACLALPDEQPDETQVVAEIYAGAADAESEPLLQPVEPVIAALLSDLGSVRRFSFGFPESGYVAWTSRESADGPELLKLRRVDDPESQITVGSDINAWDVSADGRHWLWVSGVDKYGIGTLQSAPFPEGSDPLDLVPGVIEYQVDPEGPLLALTIEANLISIVDPIGAPQGQRQLDSHVQTMVAFGTEGYVAYAKNLTGRSAVDLFVSSLDGARGCTIDTSINVPLNSVHFSPGAETALWALAKPDGYDAFHTRIADCSTVPVAPDITVLGWVGRGTALYMDEYEPLTESGPLRFRNVGRRGEIDPAPPSLIAEHVDSYAILDSTLLYTTSANGGDEGVFVRAFGQ